MSILNLHSAVLADYRDFVRSFLTIDDERVCEFVDRVLDDESRLWAGLPLAGQSVLFGGIE